MHDQPADTVLLIDNVVKMFGANRAVDGVSIAVQKGEIFGFLGPNGAGKSTTIRLLLDILRPDSGNISLLGRSNREVAKTHQGIGFLSGDMSMDTDLTGRQYLQFVNNLYGGHFGTEIDRLAGVLEANLHVKIGMYSRGNRQKIGLIGALLHKPELLILDEPTSGFDPLVQEKFAELLRQYVADGGTVFMSSHILAEVQHLCDRVAFIKGGRIITTKTVAELLDTSAKRVQVVAETTEIATVQKNFSKVAGLTLQDATPKSLNFSYVGATDPLLKFLAAHKLVDVTIREPELEEIFGQYYETSPTPAETPPASAETREADHA